MSSVRFSAVVLAAGLSSRMEGRHKLLLPVCGEPAVSDAGSETTSKQFPASFADSVSACANVNCVSKPPAGRSLWSWSWRA